MRLLLLIVGLICLSGCNSDISDLQAYVGQIKAAVQPQPMPIPKIKSFSHVDYKVSDMRSPFQPPAPELMLQNEPKNQHCQQPDIKRSQFPLEKFALDTLTMKGIISGEKGLWALIQSADLSLYRAQVGEYVGLFNGMITAIRRDEISITELLPDGTGCWQPRTTQLRLGNVDE